MVLMGELLDRAAVARQGRQRRCGAFRHADLVCVERQRDHRATDATYQRVLDAYGTAGIVELTALIGYYAMVALTLNAHEIGVPEGATPPLPDLGAAH